MYIYQPCLLALSLYAWAFEETDKKTRRVHMLLPWIALLLSEWELNLSALYVYPSVLLLLAGKWRPMSNWGEALTASILGALLGWKAADLWPLLPWLTILCAALLLMPVLLLCRSREDRFLACAMGGILFELFFCLKEYMLFSFAVVRLGSREALSLATVSMCILLLLEQATSVLRERKKHAVSTLN